MRDISIELKGINKSFKKNQILKDINLNLISGNIYGIVGVNGSGKSILLKIISGIVNPTSGSVYINGEELKKGEFAKGIGLLIDTPGLLPQYSALKNLEFLASINNKISKEQIKNTLRSVGLNSEDNRAIRNYSLGMKQKVGISQAIMENPDIVILDEPMNALDEESVRNVRDIILDLKKKGKLIIISSHNREDINILCDYIYKLDNGYLFECIEKLK